MPSLFQSISAFFNAPQRDGNPHLRRDQAILSVDDAFSIPPDTEYVTTSKAYTYPPPALGGSYDTVPQTPFPNSSLFDLRSPLSPSASSRRPTSLLPTHNNAPLPPLPSYPPLSKTWARLRTWLHNNYPELGDTLNYGIAPPELLQLEQSLGYTLPRAVRDSYLCVDGQEAESAAGCSEGLFFGLTLLPLEDVVDEWRFWREVDDDPATGANPLLQASMHSVPDGWVRREYSQRGWIPLVADKGGNYLGVDMAPDAGGKPGQVIVFGRDFDTKVVMWRGDGEDGWARWLAGFVEDLETGDGFEMTGGAEGSEGSEDDVGYESYFFDGSAAGKGAGSGDAGGGGLRLTGEYRGWAVLEALADRSMRRWIEAGVILQPTPEHQSSSATVDLAPYDVMEAGSSRTTRDDMQEPPLSPSSSSSPPTQANGDPLTPVVSVPEPVKSSPPSDPLRTPPSAPKRVKPPVPLPKPVELPTEEDLFPSPTHSSASGVYDEEMAIHGITSVQNNFNSNASFEPPLLPSFESTEKSTSETPLVLVDHMRRTTDPEISDEQGLLADTATINDGAVPAGRMDVILKPLTKEPSSMLEQTEKEEEEKESQPSVRLVGEGGTAGIITRNSDDPFVVESSDASVSGSNKTDSISSTGSASKSERRIEDGEAM
ncbi:hypothetical protein BU17DRAFT_87354 [Hysterangium stoloniferum]|nr:hypothetical protein BU17DRAFT_87354 [Hysterangium stoloniferum]